MHFLIEIIKKEPNMKIEYFKDTDTALLTFSNNNVLETKGLSEIIYSGLTATKAA